MKNLGCTIFFPLLALILLNSAPTGVFAENSAKGTLSVDGTTAQINNIYFDQYKNEFTIVLTDNAVAQDMIPYGLYELSEQEKVRALKFAVSRDTKQMIPRMGETIFFHPVWDRNIGIGEPEIKITQFDENKLVGSIKTAAENDINGHKLSYDITFSLSLKKETPKITIKGKSGPPVEAYTAYCNAIMEGNIEEFKKYVPKANLEMIPADKDEIILGLDFVRDTMMTDIEILEINTSGNNAELKMKGSRGIDSANGKVAMMLEDGSWKVSEESWELKE
jgi:hypothetical protein